MLPGRKISPVANHCFNHKLLSDTSYFKRTHLFSFILMFIYCSFFSRCHFLLYLKHLLCYPPTIFYTFYTSLPKMRFRKKLWIENFMYTWLLSNQHYKKWGIQNEGAVSVCHFYLSVSEIMYYRRCFGFFFFETMKKLKYNVNSNDI